MTQVKANVNLEMSVRNAHLDGHTLFDWVPNTKKLITCGADKEVRLWTADSDEVQDNWQLEDTPYALRVAKDDKFIVALEDHQVRSFGIAEGDDLGLVCRFTAGATALDYHDDGQLLVAGGGDFAVKLVNLATHEEQTFEGHQGPILSLALDPMKLFIVSSSCDGTMGCWSIESRSLAYHWLDVHAKSNDFDNSSTLARSAWQPRTGEVLALPRAGTIELYKRNQWSQPFCKVSHPRLIGTVSIVTFSGDGSLMAASTGGEAGTMLVWRFTAASHGDFQPLSVFNSASEAIITDVRFQPGQPGEFAVCDSRGVLQLGKISSICGGGAKKAEEVDSHKTSQKGAPACPGMDLDELADMFADIDDNELDDMNQNSNNEDKKTKPIDVDGEVSDRFNSIKERLADAKKNIPIDDNKAEDFEDEDVNDGDIGRIKSQYEPYIFGNDENDDDEKHVSVKPAGGVASKFADNIEIDGVRVQASEVLSAVLAPKYTPPKQQTVFQPSSTPVSHDQRFMVWNSVGIIYSRTVEEPEERSIDVEFHDNAFHHSIHLDNRVGYTMASLSSTALLLGSQEDLSVEAGVLERDKSRMYCQMFATWDTTKEWYVEMDDDEKIMAVAAGQTFVAAFTNLQYVRVWTTGGIQTSILSTAGPAVSLAAHDRFLMLLYHGAAQTPAAGQSIWTQVLKVDHKGKTRCHPIATPVQVALSPKATVYWAGFTDEGTPTVVDSDGVVRVWKSHFGCSWLPICATKKHGKGKSDNFFIIGLSEIQAQVRCIYCKASRYPSIVPKPTLTILPLNVPLVEESSAKTKLENECLQGRWLASLLRKLSADGYEVDETLEGTEKKTINSFIKLFALALGAERESLAMEIAGLLPNQSALEGAVRYADRQGHRSLASKLAEMIELEENGEVSGDDEANSDTELDTFANRMNADRLNRLLKERQEFAEDSNSMISLVKRETAVSKGSSSNQSSRQKIMVINDDADEEILRPVQVNIAHKGRNPFAAGNGSKTKKKRQLEEDVDDVTEICPDENARDSVITLDNEDDDDEEQGQKKKRSKKDNKTANNKKKKTVIEGAESEPEESNKPTTKITNFFKKN